MKIESQMRMEWSSWLDVIACLFAAVDVVVCQGAVESELGLEGADDFGQVRMGRGVELQVAVEDEPADVVRAGFFEGLLRSVGVGSGVEEEDGELRVRPVAKKKGSSPGRRSMPSVAGISALVTRTNSSKAGIQGPGVFRPRSSGRVAWASGPSKLL